VEDYWLRHANALHHEFDEDSLMYELPLYAETRAGTTESLSAASTLLGELLGVFVRCVREAFSSFPIARRTCPVRCASVCARKGVLLAHRDEPNFVAGRHFSLLKRGIVSKRQLLVMLRS
jgi:hypothetical protein